MINIQRIEDKQGLPFMQTVDWPKFYGWRADGGKTAREMRMERGNLQLTVAGSKKSK